MASVGQLFDDDSSSDEDETNARSTAPDPTAVSKDSGTGDGSDQEGAEQVGEEGGIGAEPQQSEGGLFGDDDDDDEDAEFDDAADGVGGRKATDAEKVAREEAEAARRAAMAAADPFASTQQPDDEKDEGEEGGEESQQPLDPKRMEVLDIPRPDQLKRSGKLSLHMTKLPNLLGINPEGYDPATFDSRLEEEEYRGYIHNMIRWRYKRDGAGEIVRNDNGKAVRESNARFVKWSDGSYTLQVGDETFEVDNLISKTPQPGFAGANGYLYLSQKATDPTDDATDGFSAAGPTVLECMGQIKSKLIPRPSILSDAHKNLTLAVRQRNTKKARIAEYVTQVDPEKEKLDRIRNKDDLNRQAARGQKGGRKGGGRRPGMNRRFLEADEDGYDTTNIRNLKFQNRTESMDYGDDSDNSAEDEWSKRKKVGFQRGSRKPVDAYGSEEEEEEEEVAYGEDSSEEENTRVKAGARKKRSRQAVFDDDDD